jgi:(1->4)-alpha-D-glucan 1-alpha-D-glucosylmutase
MTEPARGKPRATYRLQLHPGFGFAQAAAVVPYLAELGASHLYLSPVLQAAEGSTHGYDVVDPDRASEALGGDAGFDALSRAAHEAGLGILLDIVPNHMSVAGTGNQWWLDVLEDGQSSYYAHFFDVDWAAGDDRVLLPILSERYGRALASGALGVEQRGEQFVVRAGDLRLPLSPRTLGSIVRRAADRIGHVELAYLGDALGDLPPAHVRESSARARRYRDKGVLRRRLLALCAEDAACQAALAAELAAINGDPAELDALLERQNYRLAHWSVAGSQLPYRRFFDIATLVGIRNEDSQVLEASHRRIFDWLARGAIDGLRIDHVDGLREPAAYLHRLREAGPKAWIVVEKILAPGEALPRSWPVDGTTGYDFMERAGRLFVDPAGEAALTQLFEGYTGQTFDPAAESRRARLEVLSDALHSELARLTELARRACATSPACRDYTPGELERALAEILAGYPCYRTYLGEPDPVGRDRVEHAVAAAAAACPELDRDLLVFLEAALAFELTSPESIELARATQQVSGSIVAKGDEDTLLYRQVRLLSRCEVGAEISAFGIEPGAMHAQLAAGPPRALLATSTHDSKRGEDVRMRIAALSELPAVWEAAVGRWRVRAERGWRSIEPDRTLEYAMWQTLVGAWPLPLDRAQRWAEKATREARLRTSWRRPDAAYEAARVRWLETVYADREIMAEVEGFAARLRPHGDRNSLAQLLIKLAAPGVPDCYQGCELRDDSLVDPDNRRPVDLELRQARVHELKHLPDPDDLSLAKLWTIRRVLSLRGREPAHFDAPYHAIAATGPHAHRVFAFARGEGLIAAVPRLGVHAEAWRDTRLPLPAGSWRCILGGGTFEGAVLLRDLWAAFPVSLIVRA